MSQITCLHTVHSYLNSIRENQMKTVLRIIVICCLLLSAPFGLAAEKVKVATVLSKTGTASIGNIITVRGLRFAVAELNQKGGVLGKQVQLVEFDNHSTALHSKRAAEMAGGMRCT
jgi:branched-chain amino acid transport system substrate-binding protein